MKPARLAASAQREVSGASVDPALGLRAADPAAVARGAPGPDRLGAVGAADRWVAAIVKRVVRDPAIADVVPDVALGPVRERVHLPEVKALVQGELGGGRAAAGVGPADAGDPDVHRGE